MLLFEIWEASLRLNHLIRKFDPRHDDAGRTPEAAVGAAEPDPRQMSLI